MLGRLQRLQLQHGTHMHFLLLLMVVGLPRERRPNPYGHGVLPVRMLGRVARNLGVLHAEMHVMDLFRVVPGDLPLERPADKDHRLIFPVRVHGWIARGPVAVLHLRSADLHVMDHLLLGRLCIKRTDANRHRTVPNGMHRGSRARDLAILHALHGK